MTEAGDGPGLHPSETETQLYKVLADYSALSDRELSMQEGEVVELIKVGCGGWWYVRSSSQFLHLEDNRTLWQAGKLSRY